MRIPSLTATMERVLQDEDAFARAWGKDIATQAAEIQRELYEAFLAKRKRESEKESVKP